MSNTADLRWPHGTSGPRALVECENPAIQDGLTRVLREHGYTVAVCEGPQARAARTCSLVVDGACGLVDGADVVVHALDATESAHQTILSSIREHVPETPVVVEVGPTDVDAQSADVVAGCEQVRYPIDRQALIDAVDRATRR